MGLTDYPVRCIIKQRNVLLGYVNGRLEKNPFFILSNVGMIE
jgi:hypothetical protein